MLRANFEGDPNLGLFGFATEKFSLIGIASCLAKAEKELKTKAHFFPAFNTGLLGIFAIGNSSGIVISDYIDQIERDNIPIDALYLKSNYTAFGNLILMNDMGIILSPLLRRERQKIAEFFKLPCEVGTVAGSVIVGKTGIATNKGCLLHPSVKKSEMKQIEEVLGVQCDIGTVNFGSPYPGAGIIANSQGCIVSEQSSGPELGRIVESLGFL
jgi:translation initiation factor 6